MKSKNGSTAVLSELLVAPRNSGALRIIDLGLLAVLLCLALLPPFIFSGRVYQTEHFRAPKDIFCGIMILLSIGLWIWLVVEGCTRVFSYRLLFTVSMSFVGWVFFSLTRLHDYRTGIDYALNILGYALFFFLLLHTTTTIKRSRLLIVTVNLAIGLTVVYGFLQFYSLDPLFRPIKSYWSGHLMITGMLGNPNLFATLVSLCAPFLIHWMIRGATKIHRVLFLIAFILVIYIILMSYTRTALLSLGIGIGVYFLLLAARIPRKTKLKILKKAGLFLVLGLGGMAAIIMFDPSLRTRFIKPQRSDTIYQRMFIFTNTWQMFRDRPIAGGGIGSFKINYYDYQVSAVKRDPLDYKGTLYDVPYETHNDYLQILSETGIVGLSLLVLVILIYFHQTIGGLIRIEDNARASFAAANLGAVIIVLVSALSSFPFHIAPITVATFMFAATALNESRLLVKSGGNQDRVNPIKDLALRRIVQVSVMAAVVFGIYNYLNLYRYLVIFNYGLAAFQDRDPQAAYGYFMEAYKLRPERGEVAFNLALVHGALGDFTESLKYFKEVSLSYRDYKVHSAYAVALEATGDIDAAQKEHERAVFFNPTNQEGMVKYLEFCLRNFKKLDPVIFDQVIKLCRESLTKIPVQPEVSLRIGELLYDLGRYQEAEPYFQMTVKANGQNARAYYNLGKVYQRMNQEAEAIRNYAFAVDKDANLQFLTSDYERERVRNAAALQKKTTQPRHQPSDSPDTQQPPDPESRQQLP